MLLLVLPLLTACGGDDDKETANMPTAGEPTPDVEVPDSIKVGHPACISGKYAVAGGQAVAGVEAIVDWINDERGGVSIGGTKVPLEYKRYDCESKQESVTSLIERLITSDGVDFILAPYSSGLTLSGAPMAESRGVIYMDHGGASDRIFEQGFEYAVQTIGPATRYHEGTLDMVNALNPQSKRVALAYEDSEFARMTMTGAKKYAEQLGFEVVFERTYPSGVTDLTPLLSDLRASNADLVLGGGHYEDGQLFARQMADLDINVNGLSLLASATLPTFFEALGDVVDGVMGPSHWEYGVTYSAQAAAQEDMDWIGPSQDEFVDLFSQAFAGDGMPDYHAAEAGAAILSLVLATEAADSVDSDAVRAAFNDLKFMSFYGVWDIDETGLQVGHSMVDMQWQDGERIIVWPPSAAIGNVVYPKPDFP